jgi:hypothetical protein
MLHLKDANVQEVCIIIMQLLLASQIVPQALSRIRLPKYVNFVPTLVKHVLMESLVTLASQVILLKQ